jgi:hypothetical protein
VLQAGIYDPQTFRTVLVLIKRGGGMVCSYTRNVEGKVGKDDEMLYNSCVAICDVLMCFVCVAKYVLVTPILLGLTVFLYYDAQKFISIV